MRILPRLRSRNNQPTIPSGYRAITVDGCSYLVHESEIPPRMKDPVAIEEILLEMWGGDEA